jgi:hypothetical protein
MTRGRFRVEHDKRKGGGGMDRGGKGERVHQRKWL